MRTLPKHGLPLVGVLALVACGRPEPQRPITETEPQRPLIETEPQKPITGTEPQKPITETEPQESIWGPPRDPGALPLTKNEILAVLVELNTAEADMGELAQRKAVTAEVKDYAVMLQRGHTANVNEAKRLLGKGEQLQASQVSAQLKSKAQERMNDLRAESGRDFDQEFIATQVKAHEGALRIIDDELMPAAKDPQVKQQLTETRREISTHLAKAKQLESQMKGGKGGPKGQGDEGVY